MTEGARSEDEARPATPAPWVAPSDTGAHPGPTPTPATPPAAPPPAYPPPSAPPPAYPPPSYPPPAYPPPSYPPPPYPPPPYPPPSYPGAVWTQGQPAWGAPVPSWLAVAGDQRTGPLPLHPMSVGDILDGAFKLFRANARTLILCVAIFIVPVQLFTAFVERGLLNGRGLLSVVNDPAAARSSSSGDTTAALGISALVVALFLTPLIAGAVSRIVAASYLGMQLGPKAALRGAVNRFPALLGASLLVHLCEAVGLVACIVPGVALMAMFVLTAPAIAIEELGSIAGMRRSWRLVRGRFWATLGVALLSGLIAYVLGQVLGVVPDTVALLIGLRWGFLLLAAGGVLVALVTQPIVTIVATLLYFDARIRKEAFDLQVMAADLKA